jgi:hypothetical protein
METLPASLPVTTHESYFGDAPVTLVNVCDLLVHLFPNYFEAPLPYDQSRTAVMAWCADHGAAFYSAPRALFSRSAAVDHAGRLGAAVVVVEDLS